VVCVVLLALSAGEFAVRIWVIQSDFDTTQMLFYLDTEGTLPTWVSCFGLLFAGVLAWLITFSRRTDATSKLHWSLLGAGFTWMSIDEMCQYHEQLTEPLWNWLQSEGLGLQGYLRNAWVLPAALVLPVALMILVPFLRALDARVRRLFLVAGTVYLTGAMGLEVIYAHAFFLSEGYLTPLLLVLGTAKELLEIIGTGLFIHALLTYLEQQRLAFQFYGETK
jgi:hypothetical protein